MTHLGQLVPELIEVTEDLGVDTGTADAVNVAQNPQGPPPEDEGGVGVPSGQTATGDDADVVRQKLAAVCNEEQTQRIDAQICFPLFPCRFASLLDTNHTSTNYTSVH